jgi:hypothetical protein
MAFLGDYVPANVGVFATAGVPAIKLQDQTRAVVAQQQILQQRDPLNQRLRLST